MLILILVISSKLFIHAGFIPQCSAQSYKNIIEYIQKILRFFTKNSTFVLFFVI